MRLSPLMQDIQCNIYIIYILWCFSYRVKLIKNLYQILLQLNSNLFALRRQIKDDNNHIIAFHDYLTFTRVHLKEMQQ